MEVVNSIINNKIFLSAFFSWFIAQVMKSIIEIFKNRPKSALKILSHLIWSTGGMPSSHSSIVTAMATSIGFVYGPDDPLFFITFFYATLVLRDALGVRRATGLQAKTINKIIGILPEKAVSEIKQVKEIHGHSPSEVSVGVILGFFIAVAFCTL